MPLSSSPVHRMPTAGTMVECTPRRGRRPPGAAKSGTNLDQGAEAAKVKIGDYASDLGFVRGKWSGATGIKPA